jgi:neurotransmitter:Na+ symporter, NSS family
VEQRQSFSHFGFVIAAAGSAVGLGNIWKFPYITYANGGGSFVLVYLAAVLLIGAPVMMAEILIGRRTKESPVPAFLMLAPEARGGKLWAAVGFLGVFSGFVILSFYSVVAGWTVYYFGKCVGWAATGGFTPDVADSLGPRFGAFLADPVLQIGFHALFMAATMAIVLVGVREGIERVTRVLMPVLLVIMLILVGAAAFSPGFGEAMSFLFHVSPISSGAILEAVGHAFFTLSLGMGALITYGSYTARDQSIRRDAAFICLLDTMIALMAAVVMFSIIFSVPAAERGDTFTQSAAILFTTLPRMLFELPGGALLAPLFYLLVVFAALTSTISLLEVVVAYFIDHWGASRKVATLLVGAVMTGTGALAALSLGASSALSSWAPLDDRNVGVFSTLDYLATNWLLPIGGFFLAMYAGWFLSGKVTRDELETGGGPFGLYGLWRFLLRFLCPVAIGWILFAVMRGKAFN